MKSASLVKLLKTAALLVLVVVGLLLVLQVGQGTNSPGKNGYSTVGSLVLVLIGILGFLGRVIFGYGSSRQNSVMKLRTLERSSDKNLAELTDFANRHKKGEK